MCFFIKLGIHVKHGEMINSVDFGGHRAKLKVRMGIIDKCEMLRFALLYLKRMYDYVVYFLLQNEEWSMKSNYTKNLQISTAR